VGLPPWLSLPALSLIATYYVENPSFFCGLNPVIVIQLDYYLLRPFIILSPDYYLSYFKLLGCKLVFLGAFLKRLQWLFNRYVCACMAPHVNIRIQISDGVLFLLLVNKFPVTLFISLFIFLFP
jgi:hypothetical protein